MYRTASCLLVLLALSRECPAVGPLVHARTILHSEAVNFHPVRSDYDGDGIDDLVARTPSGLEIVSGLNGNLLRLYTGEHDSLDSFGVALESLPDGDGDGLRDLLVGAPLLPVDGEESRGAVYAIGSRTNGGLVTEIPLVYRVTGPPPAAGFGAALGVTSSRAILGFADSGRVLIVEASTGNTVASLLGVTSAVCGLGDVTGDGIEEIALGGADGYVVDGAVVTHDWTATTDLSGALVARLHASSGMPVGLHGGAGDRELFADLGDPFPGDGERQRLIVSASPGFAARAGSVVVHLLTQEAGAFSARELASLNGTSRDSHFGFDVASIGDATGDEVADLAVLESEFENDEGHAIGRVLVIDGAGLLDGFDEGDVVQEIRGSPDRVLRLGMRALGDQDGDDFVDLLVSGDRPREGGGFAVTYSVIPPGSDPNDCNSNGVPDNEDLAPPPLEFARPGYFVAGTMPRAVALADYDGDGRLDIAAANFRSDDVAVLLNKGDLDFRPAQYFPVAGQANSIVASDLDLDGDVDLATADRGGGTLPDRGWGNTVSVLLNRGDATFSAYQSITVPTAPRDVAAGDVNGDHLPDLAVISSNVDLLTILRNRGPRGFEISLSVPAGSAPHTVLMCDLDRDTSLDIVVVDRGQDQVAIFRNDGHGRFTEPELYSTGRDPREVVAADFNGDGHLDLASSDARLYGVSVLLSSGTGTFAPPYSFEFGGESPVALVATDIDGDGDPDLATANSGSNQTVWVLTNNGAGMFFEVKRYMVADVPWDIAAGDLDGDGDDDLVLPDATYDEVAIFPNRTSPPTSLDCNQNGRPDECDIDEGVSMDCDGDGVPDSCALARGLVSDCNENEIPDICDVEAGTSADCDGDLIPDECSHSPFHRGDADADGVLDISDGIFILGFQFLGTAAPTCLESSDANNDGAIDLSDAVFVFGYLFLGTSAPPSPGPPPSPCGSDPDPCGSPGDLGCKAYPACL